LAGSVFYPRWADPDDTGADAGIAIDNFTFSAAPEPSVYMLLGVGILLCGQRFLRRKSS
jgi:PEP-CTERM motif